MSATNKSKTRGHLHGKRAWHLEGHPLYDREMSVSWANLLPKTGGTPHQRAYLTRSVKELLLAMYDRPERGQSYSPGTVKQGFLVLQKLARYVARIGLWRFSRLTVDEVIKFLKTEVRGRDASGSPAERTIAGYITFFEEMWALRRDYVGSIRFNIASVEEQVLSAIATAPNKKWKPIDENDALKLINDALNWIEVHAQYLQELIHKTWVHHSKQVGKTRTVQATAKAIYYSSLDDDPRFKQLRTHTGLVNSKPHRVLSAAVTLTEGACVTLLLFLVGLRISELSRLDVGCLDDTSVPPVIRGVAAKKGGISRFWTAADPVPQIVEVLRSLNEDARKARQQRALLVSRPAAAPIAMPGRKLGRISVINVEKRLKTFADSSFRSGRKTITNLHPHRARKTFARFVVKRDKKALESVAYHFGHIYKTLTDGTYVGHDIEIVDMLNEENREELARVLTDLLSSKSISGKSGDSFKKLQSEFRGKLGLTTLVDKLIRDGVAIAPCDWGYCVYVKAYSACRGDDSGPAEENRGPDVCGGCQNFAVTLAHRSWWEERFARESAFIDRPDLAPQTREIVEQRISMSSAILKLLLKAS